MSHVRNGWLTSVMLTTRAAAAAIDRMTIGLIVLTMTCAFSFGAIVTAALADDAHVTCVAHGLYNGASTSDGSFFARVETGCGNGTRHCDIYVSDVFKGGISTAGAGTCSSWSRDYGNYTECAGSAHVDYSGVFARHAHNSPGYCG